MDFKLSFVSDYGNELRKHLNRNALILIKLSINDKKKNRENFLGRLKHREKEVFHSCVEKQYKKDVAAGK